MSKVPDIESLFKRRMFILNNAIYSVEDFPEGDTFDMTPKMFKKQVAYIFVDYFSKLVLPYRGVVDKYDDTFNPRGDTDVGIWFVDMHHDDYRMFISFPKSKKERKLYDVSQVRDIMAATFNNEYNADQFIDYTSTSDIGANAFIPPLYPDDDPLNTIMKTAIRIKDAPFEPYGKRLEVQAADKKHGTEGTNNKNNTKRAIIKNSAMSPSKFMEYCDIWQLDCAFIVKDLPDAMHPMFKDDSMLILYPSGIPFDINMDNLINISDIVAEGVAENRDRNDE